MQGRTLDIVNIGLMLLSCVAAYLLPFEVFLFSYAVLGPLHYLTEISWLHKRDYFATGRRDYLIFIPLCTILTGLVLFVHTPTAQYWSTTLVFMSFVVALGMVVFSDTRSKLLLLLGAMVVGYAFSATRGMMLLFSMYLPTLIHVFIFTGLFIIHGALRSKSRTGMLSAAIFVLCGASFFIYSPMFEWYHVREYVISNMHQIGFDQLIPAIISLLHLDVSSYKEINQIVFHSIPGQSAMRFIAFAYTYHYLNWFSKTSIIKWHEVPRGWLIVIITFWVVSVACYAIDYYMGLRILFLLSMLHVFLEFPLNYRSVLGIASELGIDTSSLTPATAIAAPVARVAAALPSKTKRKK
jgi:hypothetical protein